MISEHIRGKMECLKCWTYDIPLKEGSPTKFSQCSPNGAQALDLMYQRASGERIYLEIIADDENDSQQYSTITNVEPHCHEIRDIM